MYGEIALERQAPTAGQWPDQSRRPPSAVGGVLVWRCQRQFEAIVGTRVTRQ
jgi:hypothetical protein